MDVTHERNHPGKCLTNLTDISYVGDITLGRSYIYGRIILKCVLEKQVEGYGLNSSYSVQTSARLLT
jgi:hypothetical protein